MGKSTILTKLTNTQSEIAAYEFTTLTCIPGVIQYKYAELDLLIPRDRNSFHMFTRGANIQLLDTPGIIEGAASGKGRGRQVIAVARTAVDQLFTKIVSRLLLNHIFVLLFLKDLILMMLDAAKGEVQRKLLEAELDEVGIRLNKQPPQISFKVTQKRIFPPSVVLRC